MFVNYAGLLNSDAWNAPMMVQIALYAILEIILLQLEVSVFVLLLFIKTQQTLFV